MAPFLPLALLLACAADRAPARGIFDLDFARAGEDFYAAPWPGAHRLREGRVDLGAFPNPDGIPLVADLVGLLHDRATGAATTSGLHIRLREPLDPASLPSLAASTEPDAALFLAELGAEGIARRIPVESAWRADAGPFGAPNLLSLLPLQGVPLRPATRHAAVFTTALRTAEGRALPAWPEAADLLLGRCPAGLGPAACAEYAQALRDSGLPAARIAGLVAFTTADPLGTLQSWAAFARAQSPAEAPADLRLVESFDDYCVFEGSTAMPVYQSGQPPYLDEGGEILLAQDGTPALDHWETARVVLTLPRAEEARAWPLAMMIRTGGGGDRPLVDRGPRDGGGQVLEPGSGLARTFARAGWAGLSIDGPLGGARNPTGGDEQFLVFNITNPVALRDNLRQSALEVALWPGLARGLALTEGCGGPAPSLDLDRLSLVGHSMGATIAPVAAALSPEVKALVLSGAGGSWITNVVDKQSPLEVRPLAEAILGYGDRELDIFDPALHLLQWAGEEVDPPVWGATLAARGVHVLTVQGIVDTYILPPIANPLALALGLDLAGDALDATTAELSGYRALEEELPFVGGQHLALPVAGNAGGVTRVVVQHREDGVEDGHEVLFQLPGPREQVETFLRGLGNGEVPEVPEVPQDAGSARGPHPR